MNVNRYYRYFIAELIGYAQAMSDKTYEALRSLTKALELNCETILKGQIYISLFL